MLGMLVVEWSESFATILHVRFRSINAISRRAYSIFGDDLYHQGLLLVESKAMKNPQSALVLIFSNIVKIFRDTSNRMYHSSARAALKWPVIAHRVQVSAAAPAGALRSAAWYLNSGRMFPQLSFSPQPPPPTWRL